MIIFRSEDCEVDKLGITHQKCKKTSVYLNSSNPPPSPPQQPRAINLRNNWWTFLYFTFLLVSYAVSEKYQFLKQTLSIHSQILSNYSDKAGIKTLMKVEELLV